MMSSAVMPAPAEILVAESPAVKLIGVSLPQIWCSRSRDGNSFPVRIRRTRPWSLDLSWRSFPTGLPKRRSPHCVGCRGLGHSAAPWSRPVRGGSQRGRARALGMNEQTLPTAAKRRLGSLVTLSLGSNQVGIGNVLLATSLFFRKCGGCFAHPGSVIVRCTTVLHTLEVAWPIAFDDGHELVPVQFTEIVVATLFVPLQIGIRQGQAQCCGLRNNHVDKTLA